MGERLILRVFKGVNEGKFCQAVENVAASHSGEVGWNETPASGDQDFRTSHNGIVHALYLPYLSGADFLFCSKLGEVLSIPWIELRIQEGSLWDYSLYSGGAHLDNFSTLPEYWEDNEEWIATQRGNPQLLADTWKVEKSQIANYLKPWGMSILDDDTFTTVLRGKAYEEDEHEYGDIWQMFDFLRAIDARDPTNTKKDGRQHRMKCPTAQALKAERSRD